MAGTCPLNDHRGSYTRGESNRKTRSHGKPIVPRICARHLPADRQINGTAKEDFVMVRPGWRQNA